MGVTVIPTPRRDFGAIAMMLIALMAASLCVLLIACTNLANLLLARALIRRREVAVRNALGAGRERLVRQMLTESLVLAICGGLLGVLIAAAALRCLRNWCRLRCRSQRSHHGCRVLAFALALTVITGICFGVIPAAQRNARQHGSRFAGRVSTGRRRAQGAGAGGRW